MSEPKQGEKRKRTLDPDEVVDLDALAREYEAKYAAGNRLDGDEQPKRKNEDILRSDENRERGPRGDGARGETWHEAKNEVIRDLKEAGVEVRDAFRQVREEVRQAGGNWNDPKVQKNIEDAGKRFGEKFGEGFGKKFGKHSGKFSKDFGKNIGDFFAHPYPDDYQADMAESTTNEERTRAAIAHGTSLITLGAGVFSAGMLVPFLVFIPLIIYFANRDRSPFVARHAMQAFTAQLMGTFGWLALVLGSVLVGVVLSVILAITIVGIIAIPFLWLAIVLVILASFALPLGMAGFGVVGAVSALNGKNYKYPYINRWADRQARRNSKVYRETY